MSRPRLDVVIPFKGERQALEELRCRLASLELREGDTILVVDNTPADEGRGLAGESSVPLLHAAELATPGYARNRGAQRGDAEWIVFIDADTEPVPDLLDRYFDPMPGPETVLLAGGVLDEEVPVDAPGPARYAYLRRTLSQHRTFGLGVWSFAQSVNMAVRRKAFEDVNGFREEIRSAEDADLCYRLKAREGILERRENASVIHRNRRTLRAFVAQAALHGAGGAWLSRHYPGACPARRRPGLLWWGARFAATHCWRAARTLSRDELLLGLYEPLWELSFELGRSGSTELRS